VRRRNRPAAGAPHGPHSRRGRQRIVTPACDPDELMTAPRQLTRFVGAFPVRPNIGGPLPPMRLAYSWPRGMSRQGRGSPSTSRVRPIEQTRRLHRAILHVQRRPAHELFELLGVTLAHFVKQLPRRPYGGPVCVAAPRQGRTARPHGSRQTQSQRVLGGPDRGHQEALRGSSVSTHGTIRSRFFRCRDRPASCTSSSKWRTPTTSACEESAAVSLWGHDFSVGFRQ